MRKVFVIAEAGINHFGDMDVAKKLIAESAAAGADMVKFQHYSPEAILGPDSPFLGEARKCQFSRDQHEELKAECESKGVEWGVSLFHAGDVEWTEKIGMKRYKVASRASLDKHLLYEINRTKKPVFMSCGLLTNYDFVMQAVNILRDCQTTLLYCRCQYPTSVEDIELREMRNLFGFTGRVGFSSHCPIPEVSVAAAANGASVIENHVAMSRDVAGCDIPSSVTIHEFRGMVGAIRQIQRLP